MPKLRTQSYFPTTLTIDGVELDVQVKRLTNVECDAFAEALDRFSGESRGPVVDEPADARKQREAEAIAWARESLEKYLAILPDQYQHDGRDVTNGGDLVGIYSARPDVVPEALSLILLENRLSETQKKTYRSALAIRRGSANARPPAASGNEPGPTVESAAPNNSAPLADATAPDSGGSCGTTDPSPCEPVRSGVSRRKSRARSAGSSGHTASS